MINFDLNKENIIKRRLILFGIIVLLMAIISFAYAWVTDPFSHETDIISLESANISLNYRGDSPTILSYLAPGETIEYNFEVNNYTSGVTNYNLLWEQVENTFAPNNDLIYTISMTTVENSTSTTQEIVSSRVVPISNKKIYYNLNLNAGKTAYFSLTITYVLDPNENQMENVAKYFSGNVTIEENTESRNMADYSHIYANGILVNSVPSLSAYKLNNVNSWCTDGTTVALNSGGTALNYTNLTNSTNCYLYFYTAETYSYTGGVQTFSIPVTGYYYIQLWGASGAASLTNGAYTSGTAYLPASKNLYFYVGSLVSYNSGATDVRYENDTLYDRIMVAGGGGAECSGSQVVNCYGGAAGGLNGYAGTCGVYSFADGSIYNAPGCGTTTGGTQTSGYGFGTASTGPSGAYTYVNGNGVYYSLNTNGGNSGNGYWGGTNTSARTGGSGGSSYISGHPGCIAINASGSTTIKSGCSESSTSVSCATHYSGKYFTGTTMIDGTGYAWTTAKGSLTQMPNPSGGSYSSGVGNTGNGYATITYAETVDNYYYLTVDLQGGTQQDNYEGYYEQYQKITVENPVRSGYSFTGWTIEGIGASVTSGVVRIGVSNVKLTANWQ